MDIDVHEFVQGAAAALVGCIAVTVALSSGTASAQGYRAASSKTPTRAALAAATSACNWEDDRDKPPVLTGSPVLVTVRGRYIAQIYSTRKKVYVCVSDGTRAHTGVGSDGATLTLYSSPSADQLGLPATGGGSAPGFPGTARTKESIVTHIFGRAGGDVSAVAFVFADGTTTDATVENGWYYSWWPNQDEPQSVRVTSSSKMTSSSMPGSGCHAGSSGCVWAGTKEP
jgi:hypothetical protein